MIEQCVKIVNMLLLILDTHLFSSSLFYILNFLPFTWLPCDIYIDLHKVIFYDIIILFMQITCVCSMVRVSASMCAQPRA